MHTGFGLVNFKLTSTWAEHCPAYFLAISLEEKQVIIAVRGTAQVDDVITDLTALPKVSSFLINTSQVNASWDAGDVLLLRRCLEHKGALVIIMAMNSH